MWKTALLPLPQLLWTSGSAFVVRDLPHVPFGSNVLFKDWTCFAIKHMDYAPAALNHPACQFSELEAERYYAIHAFLVRQLANGLDSDPESFRSPALLEVKRAFALFRNLAVRVMRERDWRQWYEDERNKVALAAVKRILDHPEFLAAHVDLMEAAGVHMFRKGVCWLITLMSGLWKRVRPGETLEIRICSGFRQQLERRYLKEETGRPGQPPLRAPALWLRAYIECDLDANVTRISPALHARCERLRDSTKTERTFSVKHFLSVSPQSIVKALDGHSVNFALQTLTLAFGTFDLVSPGRWVRPYLWFRSLQKHRKLVQVLQHQLRAEAVFPELKEQWGQVTVLLNRAVKKYNLSSGAVVPVRQLRPVSKVIAEAEAQDQGLQKVAGSAVESEVVFQVDGRWNCDGQVESGPFLKVAGRTSGRRLGRAMCWK